jgi:UDP-N-acetylglucosamine--N-acetylmuramyl-(pentapeptide) pyrophosphoryl-undecaprenol N-acetylglucosamine transferase
LKRTEKLFDAYAPDIVVGDEEFTGVSIAGSRRVKCAFIADELQLGFARTWLARKVEARVERWYDNLQGSVDLLIVPEEGEDSGNRRFVGPIVRSPTLSPADTRSKYGLPAGRMVLFSTSGSGIGGDLAHEVLRSLKDAGIVGSFLVVTGNRDSKVTDDGVYDLGVVPDNQNLVACADLVVSTAGKSTIDEAASAGTPIIVIPIRYHVEQERNAEVLGYDPETLDRLTELLKEKIGVRKAPRAFGGEEAASRLILSLLQKPKV